eukprot:491717-Hanusia_phi.AAC.1
MGPARKDPVHDVRSEHVTLSARDITSETRRRPRPSGTRGPQACFRVIRSYTSSGARLRTI